MNFKIDTREKFSILVFSGTEIYANLASELKYTCLPFLEKQPKNIIVNLSNVNNIDTEIAQLLAEIQQIFHESNASFVICEVNKDIKSIFKNEGLIDIINQAPTESEAWDIVQMEEIERELLDSDDISFESNE